MDSRAVWVAIIAVIVIVIAGIAGFLATRPPAAPTTVTVTVTETKTETKTITVTAPTTTTTTTPAKPVVKEIKIGMIQPLSGPLAQTGAKNKAGAEFALEEINSLGGVKNCGGAKLVIVWGDSAGDPSRGAAEAERLITQEKVVALLGCYQSSVTKTASEVAERYHVPFLNGDSESAALTQRGYKWFFRTKPHMGMHSIYHFEFLKWLNETYGGLKTVAIIHEDTEWGSDAAKYWLMRAKEYGFKVVAVVSYHAATVTSLDSEVEKLKAANPDVLLVAPYTQDAILLVKTMKAHNWMPKVVLAQGGGFLDPYYIKQIGKDGYYLFTGNIFNWDLVEKIPKLREKNEKFKAKYGWDFVGEGDVDNYIAVWTIYLAIEEACKVADPTNLEEFRKAIRDALANLKVTPDEPWFIVPWKGIEFGPDGQNKLARGIITQMMPDDGKYHTVYPPEYATRDPIYPIPPWDQRD